MFMKEIKYTDYNGNPQIGKFFFNLTKGEIVEMEFSKIGGLSEYLARIVESKDSVEIMSTFKKIIMKSYGEKSPDGLRFIKLNGELAERFCETDAYSEFIMELFAKEDAASAFINGIMPAAPNPPPSSN